MNDKEIIEEAIRLAREGVNVTLPVNGNSMLPFIIGGKESVILHSQGGIVDVGDVVLAWVDGCRYVVHRIIHIDGDRITLMGDGNLTTEHCALGDIKARVTHVVSADNKKRDLYSRWRVRAAKLWYWLRPIRRYLLAIYRRL
jgi:hypothetical protein